MKTRFTVLALGTLLTGSLLLSAAPVSAWDGNGSGHDRSRFSGRAFSRSENRDAARFYRPNRAPGRVLVLPPARVPVPVFRVPPPVATYSYPAYEYPAPVPAYGGDLYQRLYAARRKLAHDLANHASRKEIMYDQMRIVRLERALGMR